MEDQTPAPSSETPSISLQDLVVLLNLVKLAADRGAIKAEEMVTVGTVYERLLTFLKSSGVIKPLDTNVDSQPE